MRELEANGVGLDESTFAQETAPLNRQEINIALGRLAIDGRVEEKISNYNVTGRLAQLEDVSLGRELDEWSNSL